MTFSIGDLTDLFEFENINDGWDIFVCHAFATSPSFPYLYYLIFNHTI
jgi:hypothetical protein